MKRIIISITVLFSFQGDSNLEYILKKAMCRDNAIISYKVISKFKGLFEKDTVKKVYSVFLHKNEKDSLYGYDFKFREDSGELIYNLDNTLYYFNDIEKKYYVTHKMNHTINNLVLPNNNFKVKDLLDTVRTSIKNNKDIIIITKKIDNQKGVTNIYEELEIDANLKKLKSIVTSADFQNSNQYSKVSFSLHDTINKIDIKQEIKSRLKTYSLIDLKQRKSGRSLAKTVKNNTKVKFKGHLLENNIETELSSYNNKILILDYWYMACYPCIKSIPHLNKLYKEYSRDDIEIIGVNIYDNKKEKTNLLKEFVNRNKIEYPILLTDENPLQIQSYPTIVILNKNKEIIYSKSGYSDTIKSELKSIIDKELKK